MGKKASCLLALVIIAAVAAMGTGGGAGCTSFTAAPESDGGSTGEGGSPDGGDSGSSGSEAGPPVGCPNYALSFNGSQFLETPDGDNEFDEPEPRTFEAWIQPTGVNASKELHIVSHHVHDQSQGWVFMLIGTPGLAFRPYEAASQTFGGGAATSVGTGKWVHVAAVWQDTNGQGSVRLFVDGKNVGEKIGGFPRVSNDYGGPLRIGMASYAKSFGWIGLIDEVRISSKPLYTSDFSRPTTPLAVTPDTIALWHFDESSGDIVRDATGRHDAKLAPAANEKPTRVSVPCFPEFGK